MLVTVWLVSDVFGIESEWARFALCIVGLAISGGIGWLIARPVLLHFLRPRLLKAREADEERRQRRAARRPDATP